MSMQSKGSVGKSHETLLSATWFDRFKIAWDGTDFDTGHQSFHNRYKENVELLSIDSYNDALNKLKSTITYFLKSASKVHIIDTPADSKADFLNAILETNLIEKCAENNTRFTFMVFPTEDNSSMGNMADIIQKLGKKADFIAVKNPTQVKNFSLYEKKSKIRNFILSSGGAEITLPYLSQNTKEAHEETEKRNETYFPFDDFAFNKGNIYKDKVDITFITGDMQHYLNSCYKFYDEIYKLLVPESCYKKVEETLSGIKKEKEKYDEVIEKLF